MAHPPRGLVGDAELALDLFRRHTVARACHEVHRKKPLGEVRPRLVENRSGARVNVVATFLTGIRLARVHRVEAGFNAACRTCDLSTAVVDFHELSEARRIIGILGLKLFECVFSHVGYPRPCD